MTELRRPEPLDPGHHDRTRLDSGEPILDEWLRRYRGQIRRRDTAATWVISDVAGVVVAYASLSLAGIDRSAGSDALAKGSPDWVPALLIGRLAVDRGYAGLGVGTSLVAHVLVTAVELGATAVCSAVVATALSARARSWWERFGFDPLDPDDPEGLDLGLHTADVVATLRRLR